MNVELAQAPYRISTGNALGNFAADGLAWAMKEYHGEDVDAAMYNTGGLRASIYAGPVTLGDIYAVFPFDNTVPIVTLTGAKFKALLEKAPGKLYVSSGVKIVKDGSAFTTLTVNGEPIDTSKNYKVAIIDYIADNDGYTSIFSNPVSRVNYVEMVRDYLGEYTKYYADRNGGKLILSDDGRIQY
jgi:2',3'-cyclic-nucleotide 2'-phosphodiesterase (5'-nucleotidase family)